ncbi:MAG TPA: fatty acid oxidation complex subunit alpha FadJ, partial [Gemmatimonadaceae bacterium]|nr:fatty acid oxidation complex subunit alpha FadJ [Gemmatimonadaceae bacterium]
ALTVEVQDGIAIITIDLPDEPVNKFSAAVIAEFDEVLTQFETMQGVKAAVLISGKPDVFIAGADIDAFLEFKSAADAEAASASGHRMMARLETSRVPVVAAIHGACLGAGLEMSLACAYRIATDHPKTVLALPETQLGLIPGAGGTQRLPKVVGLQVALDMILTAKNVRAKKALQAGLVDEMVHPAILRDIAIARATALASGTLRGHNRKKPGLVGSVLDGNPLGRAVVFRQARKMALKKTRGSYPALPAAIDAVEAGYRGPATHGYVTEARLFGEMAMTAASRELIFLFFATTSLKKETGVAGATVAPIPVTQLGVLGTGFMGAGIAAVAAMQGVPVRFKDMKHEQVGHGLSAVRTVLQERLTKKQVTRQQFDDQLSLVSGTIEYTGFAHVPLVIEAVFEDLAVKHQVLAEIERVLPSGAIFASNTSTIPIAQIADGSPHPDRVIGMHFFSPVQKMPLLEVIVTPRTAPEVIATAVAFGRKLGKTVIVVNDAPGFYVNRILAPYINEAGRMLDEGVSIEAIDKSMLDFGFPVGPITLLDEVGLDIAGKSGAIMSKAFGDRLKPSPSIEKMLAAGRLGRKSKKGFYLYDAAGKKGGVDESVYALLPAGTRRVELSADEMKHRCPLAMVNEAARCLEENIIRSPRDGDIAAVFGIGFPPFRGGPFRCIDFVGVAEVVRQLEAMNVKHPGRFVPSALLVSMARDGKRFYPATGKPV